MVELQKSRAAWSWSARRIPRRNHPSPPHPDGGACSGKSGTGWQLQKTGGGGQGAESPCGKGWPGAIGPRPIPQTPHMVPAGSGRADRHRRGLVPVYNQQGRKRRRSRDRGHPLAGRQRHRLRNPDSDHAIFILDSPEQAGQNGLSVALAHRFWRDFSSRRLLGLTP